MRRARWEAGPRPARAAAHGRGRRRTFPQVYGYRRSEVRLAWWTLARVPQAREGPQGVDQGLQGRAGPTGPRRVLLPLRRRPLLDSAPRPRKGARRIGSGGFGGLRAHNGRARTLLLPRAPGAPGRLDRPPILAVLPVQRLEERVLRRERPRGGLGEDVRVPLGDAVRRGAPGVGGLRGPQLHGGQPQAPLGRPRAREGGGAPRDLRRRRLPRQLLRAGRVPDGT